MFSISNTDDGYLFFPDLFFDLFLFFDFCFLVRFALWAALEGGGLFSFTLLNVGITEVWTASVPL